MSTHSTKQESLEAIFARLRQGEMPQERIESLARELDPADVPWMMAYVAGLGGPDDFMNDIDEYNAADNARSEVIAKGFFLFIDLVSALILGLGESAIAQARQFEGNPAHYIPWIIRYCTDERFTKDIRASYPFLEF